MLRVTPLVAAMAMRQTPLTCSGHTRPVVDLAFSGITPYGYFLISACKGEPSPARPRLAVAERWGRGNRRCRLERESWPLRSPLSGCVSHPPSSPVLVLVRRTVHCAFDTELPCVSEGFPGRGN